MAVTGRKPGSPGVSRNYNKPVHDWVEVDDTPHTGGPDLPKSRRDGKCWPDWAAEQWQVWRSMPHASLWTDSDWRYAVAALEVEVLGFERGSAMMLAEARQRQKPLGLTMDSRRDLRIRYTGSSGLGGEWVSMSDYRARAVRTVR
jgi:hypothetical protein